MQSGAEQRPMVLLESIDQIFKFDIIRKIIKALAIIEIIKNIYDGTKTNIKNGMKWPKSSESPKKKGQL